MNEFPFGYLIISLIASLILVYRIVVYIRDRKYQKWQSSPFALQMPPARAAFLKEGLGVTEEDAQRFNFDGWRFHFRYDKSVLYSELWGIAKLESGITRVGYDWIPHSSTWAITRADGGPDRRYSYNPEIKTARFARLRFAGMRDFEFVTFVHPRDAELIDARVARFHLMLAVSSLGSDYEELFSQYEILWQKKDRVSPKAS